MVNALSLFSGCGGCSLGLKQAGVERMTSRPVIPLLEEKIDEETDYDQ